MLTGPARGFDAEVIDHYGPLDDAVPKLHPATCLGQLREAASNTLRLPTFCLREKRKKAATEPPGTEGEPDAKRRKMRKPELMYTRDPRMQRRQQAPHMKQGGQHYHRRVSGGDSPSTSGV
ncbi:unnamed protein product [Cylicostephanus goldi]|uniref:Uncharacterized protein n=1 Tax=Cylicostephanus goldi TaxID=71465 RepID=A0A3P7MQC0_CYLGO|nr:unnamed protein product [Cylicostephanus goldi]